MLSGNPLSQGVERAEAPEGGYWVFAQRMPSDNASSQDAVSGRRNGFDVHGQYTNSPYESEDDDFDPNAQRGRVISVPRESSVISHTSFTDFSISEKFLSQPSSQFFSQNDVGIQINFEVQQLADESLTEEFYNAQVMPDSYYIETSGDVSSQDAHMTDYYIG